MRMNPTAGRTAADIVNTETGEVIVDCNEALPADVVPLLVENNIETIEVFYPETEDVGPIMSMTAKQDTVRSSEEALIEIYRRLRPGDPPTLESSRNLFQGMFFNPQKYDFSRVGRLKLNTKLSLEGGLDQRLLEALPVDLEHDPVLPRLGGAAEAAEARRGIVRRAATRGRLTPQVPHRLVQTLLGRGLQGRDPPSFEVGDGEGHVADAIGADRHPGRRCA